MGAALTPRLHSDSQPLHHPGCSPGAPTAPSQVPRPPSQHPQDPQRVWAPGPPPFYRQGTEALSLAQGQLRRSRGGTTLNHTARRPPATLRTSRSSDCQLTHFLLGLRGPSVQAGAQGCGPMPLGSPTSFLNRFLWAERQRPAVQEGPRAVWASVCPAVHWWHWTDGHGEPFQV